MWRGAGLARSELKAAGRELERESPGGERRQIGGDPDRPRQQDRALAEAGAKNTRSVALALAVLQAGRFVMVIAVAVMENHPALGRAGLAMPVLEMITRHESRGPEPGQQRRDQAKARGGPAAKSGRWRDTTHHVREYNARQDSGRVLR